MAILGSQYCYLITSDGKPRASNTIEYSMIYNIIIWETYSLRGNKRKSPSQNVNTFLRYANSSLVQLQFSCDLRRYLSTNL